MMPLSATVLTRIVTAEQIERGSGQGDQWDVYIHSNHFTEQGYLPILLLDFHTFNQQADYFKEFGFILSWSEMLWIP